MLVTSAREEERREQMRRKVEEKTFCEGRINTSLSDRIRQSAYLPAPSRRSCAACGPFVEQGAETAPIQPRMTSWYDGCCGEIKVEYNISCIGLAFVVLGCKGSVRNDWIEAQNYLSVKSGRKIT